MGFPSPASDYVEQRISLDELCISKPASTYFMRADRTYLHAGIFKGATLVIDSSTTAFDGSVVIAGYEGEFYLKRLQLHPIPALISLEQSGHKIPIDLNNMNEDAATCIFGVLTHCVNDMRTAEFDDTLYGMED